eukprot:TRINITY_DN6583_c0_g1_i1.p1 TRINITY_DN6583_c0_g1~~TRINITY_DN6583_c0_g1_i1.p1  ORF type:complete len:315 (-),score=-30.81 TRINITY_DN6583_c0_g1_i1:401-1345(-)
MLVCLQIEYENLNGSIISIKQLMLVSNVNKMLVAQCWFYFTAVAQYLIINIQKLVVKNSKYIKSSYKSYILSHKLARIMQSLYFKTGWVLNFFFDITKFLCSNPTYFLGQSIEKYQVYRFHFFRNMLMITGVTLVTQWYIVIPRCSTLIVRIYDQYNPNHIHYTKQQHHHKTLNNSISNIMLLYNLIYNIMIILSSVTLLSSNSKQICFIYVGKVMQQYGILCVYISLLRRDVFSSKHQFYWQFPLLFQIYIKFFWLRLQILRYFEQSQYFVTNLFLAPSIQYQRKSKFLSRPSNFLNFYLSISITFITFIQKS